MWISCCKCNFRTEFSAKNRANSNLGLLSGIYSFRYSTVDSFGFRGMCEYLEWLQAFPITVPAAKDAAVMVTEEVREQLLEASSATKKAFNSYRREADPEEHFASADGPASAGDKSQDDGEMSVVIAIMQPILRFLQLLCENHNRDLQVSQVPRARPLWPFTLAHLLFEQMCIYTLEQQAWLNASSGYNGGVCDVIKTRPCGYKLCFTASKIRFCSKISSLRSIC